MIDLTPEQELEALAALEAKEARTRTLNIKVKPGAIERNCSTKAACDTTAPEVKELPVVLKPETKPTFLERILAVCKASN
jgi:hypothetical protein